MAVQSCLERSDQATDEAHDVSPEALVFGAAEEGGCPNGPSGINILEILAEIADRPLSVRDTHERLRSCGNILHRCPVVSADVVKVIGILVLASLAEGQGLENNECTDSADRDVASQLLAVEGASFHTNALVGL